MQTDRLARAARAEPTAGQQSMRRVASGTIVNLAGALVAGVAGLGLTVVVTRGLSQTDAGVFFSATSVFILVSMLSQLGTGTGLVYFVSRCRALQTNQLIPYYLRAALRPVLVVSILCSVAIFAAASPLAELTTPSHAGTTASYLRVFAVFVPFAAMENVWLSATRGLATMVPYSVVEQVARPILQLALVAGVIFAGASTASWAWAVSYAPAAVFAWFWWERMVRLRAPTVGPTTPGLTKAFWKFTMPRSATSVIQILMQRFDIVLVGALSGAVNAAIYAAATRFVVAGQIGTTAIGRAAQPQLGHSLARGDRVVTNHIYQTSTAWLMLVTWPMFLIFIGFQDTLLRVFGKGYSAGSVVMILISLSMLVATGFGMVDMVLAMAGRTSWNLMNALVALTVNVGLDVWLVPVHGVLGAAIGWAAAILTQNMLALTQVGTVMRLHPFGRITASAGVLSVLCYLVVPALTRLQFGQTVKGLLVAGVLGSAIYAVGLWRLRSTLELASLRIRRPRPGGGAS
ncbi:MAG: polysaccharide biosynthesis C-terminal domain-containing protein [Nocardioidaceae bacterium]